MGLTLDPQLIRDLTVLISASTIGGAVFEAVRQPIINGYFIAGSLVGPGGLKLIKARSMHAASTEIQSICRVASS
jgi:Kef-type K+ transport system membrane component KefB